MTDDEIVKAAAELKQTRLRQAATRLDGVLSESMCRLRVMVTLPGGATVPVSDVLSLPVNIMVVSED